MKVTSLDKHCAAELKALRKSHKIKQTAIADYLGLPSQQFYSDLENGKKHFTNDVILKICTLFHISFLQFVNDKTTSSNLSIIMSDEDYKLMQSATDSEIKTLIYKKLFLETKIENIENRLKALQNNSNKGGVTSPKHKIHVII
jgi:transcriptional regulator with XRE-family HTH domain